MKAKLGNRFLQTLEKTSKDYDVWDTALPGFVLRYRAGGTFTYYCIYRLRDGRKTKCKIGTTDLFTPAQARDHAKEILADVTKGIDPSAQRKAARVLSLESYVEDKYGPWVEANRKSGSYMIARLKRCFFAEFRNKPLQEITAWSVEKWRSSRLKAGKRPSTVNRDISILKAAFSRAVEWDVIATNPLTKVKPSKIDQKGVVRYLSEDETARLQQALDMREERIPQQSGMPRGHRVHVQPLTYLKA